LLIWVKREAEILTARAVSARSARGLKFFAAQPSLNVL
jgi:hypothetical protein